MNKAANDSARVSGQDRKKLPALGTNQIARFRGFRPLASLEKNKCIYYTDKILHFSGAPCARQRSLIYNYMTRTRCKEWQRYNYDYKQQANSAKTT